MTRAERLAELIAEQAQDDATDRVSGSAKAESQIGAEGERGILALIADDRTEPPDQHLAEQEQYERRGKAEMAPPVRLIGMSRVWGRDVTHYKPPAPCPVCRSRPLPRLTVCACCHASGADPIQHPMRESEKARAQRERLAGGTGVVPLKRGRKRAWDGWVPEGVV